MSYPQFLDALQTQLDELVVTGSDDDLFAGGYLQGHVMLAAGQYELEGDERSVEGFKVRVNESLSRAIAAGELNPQDQRLVLDLWQQLSQ